MDVNEAKNILNISDDFNIIKLKRSYRFYAMTCHPDKGGNTEKFNSLNEAFETLIKLCSDDKTNTDIIIQGRPISELGRGYPITESATTCDRCNGKGYKEFIDPSDTILVECPDCLGDGAYWVNCKKCGGDGKFKNNNGKPVGDCFLCSGTGKFYLPYKNTTYKFYKLFDCFGFARYAMREVNTKEGKRNIKVNLCKKCYGNGKVDIPNPNPNNKSYMLCSECDGVGEIKLWNPVIPRGLFTK